MHKSVLVSLIFHVLAGVATLVWLLWGFIPTGTLFKGVMTVCIIALAICPRAYRVWHGGVV